MDVVFYDEAPEARGDRLWTLASAAWERGRRMLVLCPDRAAAEALDRFLWTRDDASFVPHEVVPPGGVPQDAEARIVLVTAEEDPLGAEILVQEGPASPDFAARFQVIIDFVDHRTPEALAASRARFKGWLDRGVKPRHVRGR